MNHDQHVRRNRRKWTLALAAALAVLCMALSGCGGAAQQSPQQGGSDSAANAAEDKKEEMFADPGMTGAESVDAEAEDAAAENTEAAPAGASEAEDAAETGAAGTGTAAVPDEGAAADAVDYALEENWAYYGIGEDKAADLFLVCPTVDMNDEYNMSMEDEDTKASFFGALNMERGIYEDSARMFAPYYRQAAMKVYSLDRSEWDQYLDFAYEDVSDAFAWYLEHENDGRPIILAGFSQGADMCCRLLEEYFGDEALQDQLVAVYGIGWPVTEEMTQQYPQIRAASSATDTGVVISFDCEAPEVTETFINPADQKALSINPLNWKTDGTPADKSENIGACFTDYSGGIRREEAGLCGCYIDETRGVLKVTDVEPENFGAIVPGLPEGGYHIYDYQFFFRNLQQNVQERLDIYLQEQEQEQDQAA